MISGHHCYEKQCEKMAAHLPCLHVILRIFCMLTVGEYLTVSGQLTNLADIEIPPEATEISLRWEYTGTITQVEWFKGDVTTTPVMALISGVIQYPVPGNAAKYQPITGNDVGMTVLNQVAGDYGLYTVRVDSGVTDGVTVTESMVSLSTYLADMSCVVNGASVQFDLGTTAGPGDVTITVTYPAGETYGPESVDSCTATSGTALCVVDPTDSNKYTVTGAVVGNIYEIVAGADSFNKPTCTITVEDDTVSTTDGTATPAGSGCTQDPKCIIPATVVPICVILIIVIVVLVVCKDKIKAECCNDGPKDPPKKPGDEGRETELNSRDRDSATVITENTHYSNL